VTTCNCDPALISAAIESWTCPHGRVWRLGIDPTDPYCWIEVPQLFGLDVDHPLPDGWEPAGAVIIVRAIDRQGQRRTTMRYAGDVMAWEAAGMLRVATLDVDRDLVPEALPGRSAP
jgi:hypothetical protein